MDELPLFGDVLVDYGQGVRQDFRSKLAIEFLFKDVVPEEDPNTTELFTPQARVAYAMDMADAFVRAGLERGWLKPLPETGDLSPHDRLHLERTARRQAAHQAIGQKAVQDEAPIVARGPIV